MKSGPAAVELSADCSSCGLEGGVIEIYDALVPACRFGIPARAACKLCAETHEGAFDRAALRPLHEVAANRCPACLAELAAAALDERRCAGCGASAALVQTAASTSFATTSDLGNALDAWARREGFASRQALLDATFCAPDVAVLFAQVSARSRLEVLADPFANLGVRTKGSAGEKKEQTRAREPATSTPAAASVPRVSEPHMPRAKEIPAAAPPPAPAQAQAISPALLAPIAPAVASVTEPPRSAPPRAILYPILSVIVADGEIHVEERRLLDRFLASEGLGPLTEEELRVHLPQTVAHLVPIERREAVVQLMCETAAIDGMPDESERRVIRAYANAWDVPDEKLEFWMWGYENINTSVSRQLWLKIRRFVLSARWENPR